VWKFGFVGEEWVWKGEGSVSFMLMSLHVWAGWGGIWAGV
jgi:hypothetical protein